jgi:hypothetical protein
VATAICDTCDQEVIMATKRWLRPHLTDPSDPYSKPCASRPGQDPRTATPTSLKASHGTGRPHRSASPKRPRAPTAFARSAVGCRSATDESTSKPICLLAGNSQPEAPVLRVSRACCPRSSPISIHARICAASAPAARASAASARYRGASEGSVAAIPRDRPACSALQACHPLPLEARPPPRPGRRSRREHSGGCRCRRSGRAGADQQFRTRVRCSED